MTPVFVKSLTNYDSYTDYWSTVKEAGFEVINIDELDWNREVAYILSPLNGEFNASPPEDRQCILIHWNLERWSEGMAVDPRFDHTWISDRAYAAKVEGATFVPFGIESQVAAVEGNITLPKRFDYAHMAYKTYRRQEIERFFLENNQTIAPNGWEGERHEALLASRVMLCTHQDDIPMIEPLRYALAVRYNLPILAEKSEDYYPFTPGSEMYLPGDYTLVWLEYPKENYHFKTQVEKALSTL